VIGMLSSIKLGRRSSGVRFRAPLPFFSVVLGRFARYFNQHISGGRC